MKGGNLGSKTRKLTLKPSTEKAIDNKSRQEEHLGEATGPKYRLRLFSQRHYLTVPTI